MKHLLLISILCIIGCTDKPQPKEIPQNPPQKPVEMVEELAIAVYVEDGYTAQSGASTNTQNQAALIPISIRILTLPHPIIPLNYSKTPPKESSHHLGNAHFHCIPHNGLHGLDVPGDDFNIGDTAIVSFDKNKIH